MHVIKISNSNPDNKSIQKAAEIIKGGGIIVYPTDTTYGLGGNALNENAIKKVYELKGRDYTKPTHVVVKDWDMIKKLCFTNGKSKTLYKKFLPGPLTMILPKKNIVPNTLTGNLSTLGIRIPRNLITQSLSNLLLFPYTTPSANRNGEPTPYSIKEVKAVLNISNVDLILDAGKLPTTPPSTMVDLSVCPPMVLREGPVSLNRILKVLIE